MAKDNLLYFAHITAGLILIMGGLKKIYTAELIGVLILIGVQSTELILVMALMLSCLEIAFGLLLLFKNRFSLYGAFTLIGFYLVTSFYGVMFDLDEALICFGEDVSFYFEASSAIKSIFILILLAFIFFAHNTKR